MAQEGSCPPRPAAGVVIKNPLDLSSINGVLKASFTFRSDLPNEGYLEECYIYETSTGKVEAPTLRLNPGDQLELSLTNRLSYVPPPPPGTQSSVSPHQMPGMTRSPASSDPCSGGSMLPTSTNIHFHGMNIPPKCHQDEIIVTDIANTDPPFLYSFQVPANDAPGMYWYHPHLHGEATLQVNGGAAGALIVGGIEKLKPQVGGLPERILILRQQFGNPNSWLPGPNQLTLNFAPCTSPSTPANVIKMKPGAKEFWRVANSTSQAFLNLQIVYGGTPQGVELIALDGIPVKNSVQLTTITLPPAGRAEFVMTGPAAGEKASFQQSGFNTGPIGNPNPRQQLAAIEASADAEEPSALPPGPLGPLAPPRFAGLETATVTAQRTMYFAEATNGSNGPTEFFMGVEGQPPQVFNPSLPPAVVTKIGAVEDWTIENHTGETHAFHIHQIHFLFMEVNGARLADQELRDTVVVPAWNGLGPYPSVKLRMDFREPQIAGTFVFHCHVLDHEDAGMMAKIQVNPK